MELTSSLIAIIIITSLASSMLSLGAKLIYDGIKARKNGSNGNGRQISVNLALLAKDIDFNNKQLAEIGSGIHKLVELGIVAKEQTNNHLVELKSAITEQASAFRSLTASLITSIAKLEGKL